MLHTVNKSPFEKDSLDTCLRLALPGSDILLIEDAVVGALAGTRLESVMTEAVGRHRVHVLEADITARGIAPEDLVPGVSVVDYGGFVDLAAGCEGVQSWL